jgi:hypothetical protein
MQYYKDTGVKFTNIANIIFVRKFEPEFLKHLYFPFYQIVFPFIIFLIIKWIKYWLQIHTLILHITQVLAFLKGNKNKHWNLFI